MKTKNSFNLLKVFILVFVLSGFTKQVKALPDLVVQSLVVSKSQVNPGESIQVQFKIKNIGDATAGSSTVRLYFSLNSTITTSDTYLNYQRIIGSLAAGATSATYTATVAIPTSAPAGARYIGSIVDYDRKIAESNENNNTRSVAITVNTMPNLSVSILSIDKTKAIQGETVQVQYAVRNSGTGDASNLKLRLYFSSNSTITTSDTYLGHERTFSSIPAGSNSATYTANITIPASAAEGSRFIGAVVDYDKKIVESDENDNTRAVAITVNAVPDLEVSYLRLNKISALQGEIIQIQYKVQNSGYATANNFKFRIYFSYNSTITTGDSYMDYERTFESLPSGGNSDIYTTNVTIPSNASVGTRYIGCIVDYDHKVTESNESNNTASQALTVNLNDKPDLFISSLTLDKSSAAPGDIVQVQYRVGNNGSADAGNFKLRLYLSNNSIISTADTYLNHERTFATLNANSSSSDYTANVRIPSTTTGGILYIGGVVDYDHQVDESIESNNTGYSSINVCSGFTELSNIIGDTAVCENTTKTYSIPAVAEASSYTWTLPQGWTGSSISNSITCSNISTAGTIHVVANNICGDVSPEQSLDIITVVMPDPVVTLEDGNILHSSANDGNQWYLGDNPVEGATGVNYAPNESGNYYVVVTNDCGTSISNSIDYVVTAIESVDENSGVNIYPNPAVNSVHVNIDDEHLLNSKMFLINSNGIVVKQISINSASTTLDFSGLTKGVYIVRLVSEKAVRTKKLILK